MIYLIMIMDIKNITLKKKNKESLTFEELEFVVNGFIDEKITKQEMTDFLFACVNFGLSDKETFDLTKIMTDSGEKNDLSGFKNTIDKHSSGGVSDTTTLIVVPLFALLGFTSIKMSGGSLGHSGGTADKLKAFDGLENTITMQKAKDIAKKCGACFVTSTKDIAPADKKIYALRDEINAMSVSLIASSIMSKKIASGSKHLVLDVKYGQGAFIDSKQEALGLAQLMQKIGEFHGVETTYVLGDMNNPLGNYVGNTMETWEVLKLLKTAKMTPLLKHSLNIVSLATHKVLKISQQEAFEKTYNLVKEGKVLEKLKEIITLQGGSFELLNKQFKPNLIIKSQQDGTIDFIDVKEMGFLDNKLKNEAKNYLGFQILKNKGETVKKGEVIFNLFFEVENKQEIINKFNSLVEIK